MERPARPADLAEGARAPRRGVTCRLREELAQDGALDVARPNAQEARPPGTRASPSGDEQGLVVTGGRMRHRRKRRRLRGDRTRRRPRGDPGSRGGDGSGALRLPATSSACLATCRERDRNVGHVGHATAGTRHTPVGSLPAGGGTGSDRPRSASSGGRGPATPGRRRRGAGRRRGFSSTSASWSGRIGRMQVRTSIGKVGAGAARAIVAAGT